MSAQWSERLMRTPPRTVVERLASVLKGRARQPALNTDMPCFFVLSTGRTGTKTLAELLNASAEATVHHEPHPHLSALGKLAYDTNYQHMDTLAETFLASRETLLRNAWASSLAYGETGPYVTFLAPVIARVLPRSAFIHVVRDPLAVVRSGLSRRWYQGQRYDARRVAPRPDDPTAVQWPGWSPLEKSIWLWTETNAFIRRFCGSIDGSRHMLVRAEDIFAGSRETVAEIFRFLHLTPPHEKRIAGILAKRLNRQKSPARSLDSWAPDWRSRFLEIAGEEMKVLGYELPPA